MTRRTLEFAAPGAFVAYGKNARTHSEAQVGQIIASIAEFGFTNPVLVDEDMGVIAGHGRLLAAERMQLAEVPFLRLVGLTAAQKRALVLADNKLGLNSGWDLDLLKSELGDLRADGFDLGVIGFDTFELADIFATKKGKTEPDDAPPLEERAVTVEGDTWLLGAHRITCGDSTNADTVARALGGLKPHLMVTDPPYGVNYDASWRTGAGVGSKGAAVGKVLNDGRADWSAAWALFPG
ncbi:MAG: ParB/Srx family N-terminal domain-containing protein, partial [Alphaproteobacteria bacterium]